MRRIMYRLLALFISLTVLGLLPFQTLAANQPIRLMTELHTIACDQPVNSKSPWRINNLYDCTTKKLFIPYRLWTAAPWNGNKDNACMHQANSLFNVDGNSETTIIGPKQWHSPKSKQTETIWIRSKVNGSKDQYFTCHEKGIGRVYDSRRPKYYLSGRCKFPAGNGWKIKKRRNCNNTAIQITELGVDASGTLTHLIFKWWVFGTLDHIYRYAPEYGMTNAWQQ